MSSEAARILGRLGGKSKSKKKARAARKNGKKGGKPKACKHPVTKVIPEGKNVSRCVDCGTLVKTFIHAPMSYKSEWRHE